MSTSASAAAQDHTGNDRPTPIVQSRLFNAPGADINLVSKAGLIKPEEFQEDELDDQGTEPTRVRYSVHSSTLKTHSITFSDMFEVCSAHDDIAGAGRKRKRLDDDSAGSTGDDTNQQGALASSNTSPPSTSHDIQMQESAVAISDFLPFLGTDPDMYPKLEDLR